MFPKWRSVLVIGILAAIFTAIYKSMDNITVHNFIVAKEDEATAAFAYLIVGGWIGAILSIVFGNLIGKRIDPDFKGIVVKNTKMHTQAAISGIISAGSTLFLLWGNQKGDPSVLIALGNAVVVYTIMYDVFRKKALSLSVIALPTILVLSGAAMAAFNGFDRIELTLFGLLFVVVLSNGLSATSEVVEQIGVRASDSINLFIWRFLWLASSGTLIAISVSAIRGKTDLLMETIKHTLPPENLYILWIGATMFFVFLGIGLKLYAKKGNSVSVVLLIISVQMVVAFPITIIGDKIWPGCFGNDIPTDLTTWLVRIAGAALMIWGITKLRNVKEKTV